MIEQTLAMAEEIELTGSRMNVSADGIGDAAEAGSAELFATDTDDIDSRPVVLKLSGLSYEEAPGVVYQVYINLPENTEPDPSGKYYAGTVAPFGFENGEGTVSFDVSGLLNRLIESGEFLGGSVNVEFVPYGLDEEEAEGGLVIPAMSIKSIEVLRN